jgi:hypothetical protein
MLKKSIFSVKWARRAGDSYQFLIFTKSSASLNQSRRTKQPLGYMYRVLRRKNRHANKYPSSNPPIASSAKNSRAPTDLIDFRHFDHVFGQNRHRAPPSRSQSRVLANHWVPTKSRSGIRHRNRCHTAEHVCWLGF